MCIALRLLEITWHVALTSFRNVRKGTLDPRKSMIDCNFLSGRKPTVQHVCTSNSDLNGKRVGDMYLHKFPETCSSVK